MIALELGLKIRNKPYAVAIKEAKSWASTTYSSSNAGQKSITCNFYKKRGHKEAACRAKTRANSKSTAATRHSKVSAVRGTKEGGF